MRFSHLSIEGLAAELPPRRISSAQIEERLRPALTRLKLPGRPLEALTGIIERRAWEPGSALYQVGARAVRQALGRAGITPDQVGALVSTSVSRAYLEPSTASMIHAEVGFAPSCRNFDIANACLGFLEGITVAGMMIERGAVDYAVVVAAETADDIVEATIARLLNPASTLQDFWANFATLTLGSGAAAMVLGRADRSRTGHRILGEVTRADSSWNHLCRGTATEMHTDSARLLKAGVELARQTWAQAERELPDWSVSQFHHFVAHQVGRTHLQSIAQALGVPVERCPLSYPYLGNVGPAAIPMTLALAMDEGRVHPGEALALMGIGSGLNVTMMQVRW